tara:strand:+ start:305 stop:985 length:681 start_codon:yes stop_codon:yes gene_type:complete
MNRGFDVKRLYIMAGALLGLGLAGPVSAQDAMVPVYAMQHAQKGDVEAMRALLADHPDYVMRSSMVSDVRAVSELLGMAAIAPNASLEMIELLVESGADPDAQPTLSNGAPGLSPLQYALSGTVYDRPEGEKMFRNQVALGSIPDARATPEERLRIIQYLIDNGADPNRSTLMANAVLAGPDYVRVLIEGGADPNPVSDNGASLLEMYRATVTLYEQRLALLEAQS